MEPGRSSERYAEARVAKFAPVLDVAQRGGPRRSVKELLARLPAFGVRCCSTCNSGGDGQWKD
jgi:hypothetical protein